MAGFTSQALLRSKYEDLIDESEQDVTEKLQKTVGWLKQVFIYNSCNNSTVNPAHDAQTYKY